MDKQVVIATHDGMFHADDCFAVAALLSLLDSSLAVSTVVRTRDETLIRKADFAVDVGGVHDAEKNRFDHHQEGGAGKRENGIPYAAFGLVWEKFGLQIAGSKHVAALVEKSLVIPIDAGDNGVDVYKKIFADVAPYCIEDFIHNIRPTWQENVTTLDSRFLEAVSAARTLLSREMAHAHASVTAEALVRKAYDEASDKRIIALDAFYPHEKILSAYPEPLFAVFPRPDSTWNVKAIRDDVSSFKNRRNLPMEWAGKRDAELARVTGVPDAFFCHNGRFLVVAKSKDGAVALAKLALNS